MSDTTDPLRSVREINERLAEKGLELSDTESRLIIENEQLHVRS